MMSQQQTIPNQMMGAPSGHGSMSSYSSSGMLPSDPSGSTSSSYGGSDAPVVDSLAGAPLKTSTGRRMSGTQELLMKINSQKNGMPEGPSPYVMNKNNVLLSNWVSTNAGTQPVQYERTALRTRNVPIPPQHVHSVKHAAKYAWWHDGTRIPR
jgi:hypothetical protein